MTNIAIYLRKSREEDNETREETLARHESILFDYCKKNDLTITKIFREVVSGESISKLSLRLSAEEISFLPHREDMGPTRTGGSSRAAKRRKGKRPRKP